MKNQRGFSLIIATVVILVVAAIAVGGYFIYQYLKQIPTPITDNQRLVANETADWKTYQNSNFGFEIKYPLNFQIDEIGFTQRVRGLEEYPYQIAFGVGENPRDYILSIAPSQLSSNQWAEQSALQNKVITPVTFDGIEGVKVSGKYRAGIMDGFSHSFYTVSNNKVYIFDYSYYDDKEEIDKAPLYLKYFDQMISTLKFLK